MSVLADTSIWIEYVRRGERGIAWALDSLLARGEVIVCGPVIAEILAGADRRQQDEVWIGLIGLPWAELGRTQWLRVGEVASELRRRGVTPPLTDIEIAVAADHAGAELWARDVDFDRIGEVLPGLRRFEP